MKNIFLFFLSAFFAAGAGYVADTFTAFDGINAESQRATVVSQFTDDTPEPPSITHARLSIIFGGDLMFDRGIRRAGETRGYLFLLEDMREILNAADFVVANLEGPITTHESVSVGTKEGEEGNVQFTFDPQIVPLLKEFNIGAVSLGNNHILNFGSDGLAQTREHLFGKDVPFFGDPEADGAVYLERGEIKISFIAYNQFVRPNEENAKEYIRNARARSDIVVVYAHWGEEYETRAREYVKTLARSFIDSGADVVVGAHPHVVQEREMYGNGVIYYSLGNFVFDQYFSDEVRCGLLVRSDITKRKDDGVTKEFSHIPVFLEKNGKTVPYGCALESY